MLRDRVLLTRLWDSDECQAEFPYPRISVIPFRMTATTATFADAIEEAIRRCLPSAIVSVDAEAIAVTIAVKDADLVRSLISLGIDEYNWEHASRQEPAIPVALATEDSGLKELVSSVLAPLVSKPA